MKRATLERRLQSLLLRWFLLVLVVAGVAMSLSYARFRDTAVEDRMLLARSLAGHLDASIAELFTGLRELSVTLSSALAAARDRPDEGWVPELRASRFQHLFRDTLYVVDAGGRVAAADPAGVETLPAADLPRHEAVTSLRRKSGGGEPFVAAVQPFGAARDRYTLVAEMNLASSAVSELLRDLAVAPEIHLFVVDADGRVIAASEPRALLRTVPAVDEVRAAVRGHRGLVALASPCWVCDDDAGGEMATVMASLRYAPWGVVLQEPRARVFAALYAVRDTFLGTLALLVILGVLLRFTLARVVTQPLRELSQQAERLRRGELEAPIAVAGDDEVLTLARTLEEARRRLLESFEELRRLNETLEEQVASRTEEIRSLLADALARDAERRTLVRRLLGAGEEERKRIARELHDEISQLLTVIQLSLEGVAVPGSELTKAKDLLVRAQAELHRLIYDLRPSLLDDLGLAAAVKWYAENVLEPRGVEVGLEIEEGLRLAPEIEITVFRIYQEIVTNILRHARAEQVSVELYAAEGKLVLAVEDDGVGFDPAQKSGGAGIVGMRERADLVGGRVRIDSEPETGTQVVAEFPLDPTGPPAPTAEVA